MMKEIKGFYFLLAITLLFWVLQALLVNFWLPSDVRQGVVQRIFYYHVPTAWVSFIAFFMVLVYSILYLKTQKIIYDHKAYAHTLVGWFLTSGVLITGPLWAKPVWGAYWNWSDERLITFFILWLIYSSYFLLRFGISDEEKKRTFAAVIGIIAFINVPLVYLSIRIWKTPSHPAPVVGGDSASGIDPNMRLVMWLTVVCFLLSYYIFAKLIERNMILKKKLWDVLERK